MYLWAAEICYSKLLRFRQNLNNIKNKTTKPSIDRIEKCENFGRGGRKMIIAVISTIAAGVLGDAIGGSQNAEWGAIAAIAVMGGFIIAAIKNKDKE